MESSHKKLLALGCIAGGLFLAYRARHDTNPVNGLGRFSIKRAVQSVSNAVTAPIAKVVPAKIAKPLVAVATGGGSLITQHVSKVVSDPKSAFAKIDPIKNLSKSPVFSRTLLAKKFFAGKPTNAGAQPQPGQEVVYQDAQGNTISQSVYDQIMAVANRVVPPMTGPMPGGLYVDSAGQQFTNGEYTLWLRAGGGQASPYQAPVSNSAPFVPPGYQFPTQSAPVSYTAPPAASGGGGGGGGDGQSYADAASAFGPGTSTAPAAEAQQQYATAPADLPAQPAKKMNPFVVIGTLLAVPVVMAVANK